MTLQLPPYEKARILVAGDVMLDRYWQGSASRISPEAPVPIVAVNQKQDLPGAAANVALNIAALGAKVSLLSMTGNDRFAEKLEILLKANNVQPLFEKISHAATISKLRVLSHRQQLIRLDFDENFSTINPAVFLERYAENLKNSHLVILSDYGKGVLACAPELIKLANQAKIPVFIDPKGDDYRIYQNADLLTPNQKEFETIAGKCFSEKDIAEKALTLIKTLNLKALLVTRGEEGMSFIRPDHPPLHLTAKKEEVFDVTGAGDTVISVLGASAAAGASLEQAVVLANLCAGIVVSKLGACAVSLPELRRALQNEHSIRRGIINEEKALQLIQDAHAHNETVVMTNGCFDILHPGHIAYLEQAKKLGDYLIVAVNADDSVRKLKGKDRPINSLTHRMTVLAALSCIDWVLPFSEETPERLIQKLLPDRLVKGGDYAIDAVAGAEAVIQNGGQVKILDFIDGYSTTQIIETMRLSE